MNQSAIDVAPNLADGGWVESEHPFWGVLWRKDFDDAVGLAHIRSGEVVYGVVIRGADGEPTTATVAIVPHGFTVPDLDCKILEQAAWVKSRNTWPE